MLKPISSYVSPEITNEPLETTKLSTARTKGTTACSSASHFLLSDTFDAGLKAASSVWDGLRMLYYSLVCFVMPSYNAMRVFHIHTKATEAKLCLLSFCSTAAKLCFEVITQIRIKRESRLGTGANEHESTTQCRKDKILIYIHFLLLAAFLTPDSSA